MSDRKFDVWKWCDPRVSTETFEFEVRMFRPDNIADGPIQYYIERPDDPHINVRADDLAHLRNKLDKAIREWGVIKWEPVLVVVINPSRAWHVHREFGTDFAIHVHEYERGTRAGKPYYRKQVKEMNGAPARRYGVEEWVKKGVLGETKLEMSEDGAQVAIVRDTLETRAALRAIRQGFLDLLARLKVVLGPEKAEETLSRIDVGRLLAVDAVAAPPITRIIKYVCPTCEGSGDASWAATHQLETGHVSAQAPAYPTAASFAP